jgi:predicted secreted protein
MPIFNRLRVRRNESNSSNYDNNKVKRFVHSPLESKVQDVEVKIAENGIVTLSKFIHVDEKTNEDIYDTISVPASVIFKTADMLNITRSVKYIDKSEISKYNDKSNEKFDNTELSNSTKP